MLVEMRLEDAGAAARARRVTGRDAPLEDGPQPALPETRLAEMRRVRAERRARLHTDAGSVADSGADSGAGDPAALEAFLRVLRAAIADAPPAPGAAVLPFRRAPDRAAERLRR